jgi:hypothetical protein
MARRVLLAGGVVLLAAATVWFHYRIATRFAPTKWSLRLYEWEELRELGSTIVNGTVVGVVGDVGVAPKGWTALGGEGEGSRLWVLGGSDWPREGVLTRVLYDSGARRELAELPFVQVRWMVFRN